MKPKKEPIGRGVGLRLLGLIHLLGADTYLSWVLLLPASVIAGQYAGVGDRKQHRTENTLD
jgi:hypothetical protein